jgi:hypothetical protein
MNASVEKGGSSPRGDRTSRMADTNVPTPPSPIIQPMVQGVPSANQPTKAEAVPALCGKAASAPATELATISPDMDV